MKIKPWRRDWDVIRNWEYSTKFSLFLLVAFRIFLCFLVFYSFYMMCLSVVKINVFHQFRKTHSHYRSKYCSPSSFCLKVLLDEWWISCFNPLFIFPSLYHCLLPVHFFSQVTNYLYLFSIYFFLCVAFLMSMPYFLFLWSTVWFLFQIYLLNSITYVFNHFKQAYLRVSIWSVYYLKQMEIYFCCLLIC